MKKILLNPVYTLIPLMSIVLFFPAEKTESITTGRQIKRIVSLSPAITRQIADLESEHLLAGVTSYHPPLSRKVDIVGTLVQPNIEKIVLLRPDIVFFSEEDNKVQFTEMFTATKIPTRVFGRNDSFKTICAHYLELAEILGKKELAIRKLEGYRKILESSRQSSRKMRLALFVSNEPLLGVSDMSYIGKMIRDAGGINTLRALDQPYPTLSLEHLVKLNPDIIISIMYHDDSYRIPFSEILKDFPELTAMKNDSMYSIPLDSVCYYTPGDYVLACRQISQIINREIRKRNSADEN